MSPKGRLPVLEASHEVFFQSGVLRSYLSGLLPQEFQVGVQIAVCVWATHEKGFLVAEVSLELARVGLELKAEDVHGTSGHLQN